MGWGNHCAEVCKLTGLFLLNGIKNIIPDLEVGLYMDYGIVVINKNTTSVEVVKLHKAIGIRMTIENPATTVNYLGLNLNLINIIY